MPRKLKFKTKVKRFHKKYGKYFLKIGLPVLTIFSLIIPVFFVEALVAVVDETKVDYVTKPFKLSPANGYRDVGGQPTGAGSWNSSGKPGDYPESSCLPILATVSHRDTNTGDINMVVNYSYKHNGNPTDVVGFDHLEKVTTALGNPGTATNLNQLSFSLADFTAATSFKSAGSDINAQVNGPYGDDGSLSANPAVTVNDTKRHYDVVLYNVPRDTEVYVLLCARLGPDSGEFPGGSMQVGAGNGQPSNINPGDILLLPSITINGTVTSGTATPDQWTYTVSPSIGGISTYNFAAGASSYTINDVSPDGRYAISASGPFGYTLTGISGTNCEAIGLSASTTVRAGDPAIDGICNFTFAPVLPNLTVTPTIINDDGGPATTVDLALLIDGGGADFDIPTALAPGLHQVTPSITVPGYVRTIAGDCASDGSITLVNGDNKTCTVTFDDLPITLNVYKYLTNDNGGTLSEGDFTMNVYQGSEIPVSSFPGARTGTAVTLNPGVYSVSEDAVSGYVGSLDDGCTGTIQNGDVKNCTITNDDQPATLVVTKHVVNDESVPGIKTAGDFIINITGTNVSATGFPGDEAGTTVTLDAGGYSVDENADSEYAKTIGTDCSGSIGVGETRYCTLTNDDVAPPPAETGQVTVISTIANNYGGTLGLGNFLISAAGNSPAPSSFYATASPGQSVIFGTGAYGISTASNSGYSSASAGDCSGVVAKDDVKTCYIDYNDIPGRLTVVVNVNNTHGGIKVPGDFTIRVTDSQPATTIFNGADAPGTITFLKAGEFTAVADADAGYDTLYSADCSGNVNLDEDKTCTITENDKDTSTPPGPFVTTTGTINVIVDVINNDGDNKIPGDFTVQVTAVNPSATTFAGSAGTPVTVDAGSYSVDTLPVNMYSTTLSAECSGAIAAGETKNCTITQDDLLLIISDITTSTVSDTAVQVNWHTNHPATSRVVYGLVSVPNLPEFDQVGNYGYEFSTTEDETLILTHSVIVTGLTPSTMYFLRPVSHGSPEVTGDEVSISTASASASSGGGTTYSSSYTSPPGGGGSSAPPSTPAPVVIPLALAPQAVLGTKIEAPEEVVAPQAVLGFTTLPNTGGPSNVLAYAVFGLILQAAGIVAIKKASRLTKA